MFVVLATVDYSVHQLVKQRIERAACHRAPDQLVGQVDVVLLNPVSPRHFTDDASGGHACAHAPQRTISIATLCGTRSAPER